MSVSETRIGVLREILMPVREQVDRAALATAYRQSHDGLTDWEAFGLTLCLVISESLGYEMDGGDGDGDTHIAAMIRVADDVRAAMAWPEREWWAYIAATAEDRDTLDLIRHVHDEIASGERAGLSIFDGFMRAVQLGGRLIEEWELDQALPGCVGQAVRASI
jgi:hypothetical protein